MNKLCEMCKRKCKVMIEGAIVETCVFLNESDEARRLNKELIKQFKRDKQKGS